LCETRSGERAGDENRHRGGNVRGLRRIAEVYGERRTPRRVTSGEAAGESWRDRGGRGRSEKGGRLKFKGGCRGPATA